MQLCIIMRREAWQQSSELWWEVFCGYNPASCIGFRANIAPIAIALEGQKQHRAGSATIPPLEFIQGSADYHRIADIKGPPEMSQDVTVIYPPKGRQKIVKDQNE